MRFDGVNQAEYHGQKARASSLAPRKMNNVTDLLGPWAIPPHQTKLVLAERSTFYASVMCSPVYVKITAHARVHEPARSETDVLVYQGQGVAQASRSSPP